MAIITLTTDIGTQDFLVGAIKGQILQQNVNNNIVDITHSLIPFNYPHSAYICRSAIKNFPENSYHIVIADFFDGKPEHILFVKHNSQYIACADNGLLTMILEETPQQVVKLSLEKSRRKNLLYCTRIILNAIAKIESGENLESTGTISNDFVVKNSMKPLLGPNYIEGQIMFIDNFENVVVNIRHEQFEEQRKGRKFQILFKRNEIIDRISETYADVQEGELLATFNSANYLEISMNKGNVSGLIGLQRFSDQPSRDQAQFSQTRMMYQTVKIIFIDQ